MSMQDLFALDGGAAAPQAAKPQAAAADADPFGDFGSSEPAASPAANTVPKVSCCLSAVLPAVPPVLPVRGWSDLILLPALSSNRRWPFY